ncbi:MAG: hypothetical protein VCC99_07670 [Alphaproteobacteria bacterium]
MQRLFAVAAALALGSCGLPPVINLASFALNGMSLLSTGKSVSDHVLSAAAEKDCAVWRLVKNEDVCREYDADNKSGVVLAEAKREHGTEIVGRTDSKPVMLAFVDPVVLLQFTSDGVGLGIAPPSGQIGDPIGGVERAPNPDLLVRASTNAPGLMLVGAIEQARGKTRSPTFKAPVADHHASAGELALAATHKVRSARPQECSSWAASPGPTTPSASLGCGPGFVPPSSAPGSAVNHSIG